MENTIQSFQRSLFDDLIRPRQHLGRNRQADLLGGLEVDDELELRRLLDRQVSGLCTLQDLVHVDRSAPVISFSFVGRIGHENAGLDINDLLSDIEGNRFLIARSAIRFPLTMSRGPVRVMRASALAF